MKKNSDPEKPAETKKPTVMNEQTRKTAQALIMMVLADKPRHGYGIAREVEKLSDGEIRLTEATIYPALARLEFEGLVTSVWEQQPERPPRRVFQLTEKGRPEVKERLSAIDQFLTAFSNVIKRGLRELED
jgi:DNA-binding PadR family transcriptional regulator